MRRAILDAQSAVGTEIAVYMSHEVFNGDRTCRTVLLALHAAYAAHLADLAGDGAFVLVGAHDLRRLLAVGYLDELLGTYLGALAAADAEIAVYNGNLIAKLDGVIIAFPCAVAETDAAVLTGIHSAVEQSRSSTGIHTCVIHLDRGVVACAETADDGGLGRHVSRVHAENGGTFVSDSLAADRTHSYLCLAFGESGSISGAARKSAGAAVGSRKSLGQLFGSLVHRNRHDDGSRRQSETRQ